MKTPPRALKLCLFSVTVCLGGAFGFFVNSVEQPTLAQTPPACATPDPGVFGQAGSWAPNHAVTVNINPDDFNPGERECLRQAFENWNNANGPGGTNSGVYFRVQFSTQQVASLNSSNQAVGNFGGASVFQVNRGTPLNGAAPAEVYQDNNPGDGRRTAAYAVVDARVTD